ncbi:hypothetical protein FSP39_018215 [Pinctada imbricata]|uniref:B box-type domain-containing protein n=1 Tax=Pinctada imbricata TaxID=66713 RepID=A0AA88YXC8_PINIB|nr:hypothetical protein FSP39_018215 [Pinctada imbricata]
MHVENSLTHYCIPCDETVCCACVSSRHAQHQTADLVEYIKQKKIDISKHKIQIAAEHLPQLTKELEVLKQAKEVYQISADKVTSKAQERAELMKQVIDLVLDSQLSEIQKVKDRDLDTFIFRENEICFQIEDMKKIVADENGGENAESESDFNIISAEREMKQKLESFSISERSRPLPPKFIQGIDDMIPEISRLLGKVERVGEIDGGVTQRKSAAEVKVQIMNTVSCAKPGHKVTSICQTSSNDVIVAYNTQKSIDFIDRNGRKLKAKKLQFETQDITMNKKGDLFLTVNDSSLIYKMKTPGNPTQLYNGGPYKALGLCAQKNGNLAAALWKQEEGIIAIINSGGKLTETISYDRTGNKLFKKPYRICENSNGDLIVTDSALKTVTGVDPRRHRRFQYNGGTEAKNFIPIGVACDSSARIIVSNWKGNSVHLLTSDGEFFRFILSSRENVTYPHALSIDSLHRLWIAQKEKVVIVKYLK